MNVKKYAASDGALFLILMRLQICCAYGAKGKVMETVIRFIKIVLPLAIVATFLFGYVLHSQSALYREFEAALLSVQWIYLSCIVVWCSTFLFLTFGRNDLPFIALLLIAISVYFIGLITSRSSLDAIIFLAALTLGKGMRFCRGSRREPALTDKQGIDQSGYTSTTMFLIGIIVLLTFSSLWHLQATNRFYPVGVRWTGLWDNPNIYGMLMGAGVVLAIGLRAAKRKAESGKRKLNWFLFIVILMMGVGLVMSYSRGAWLGTVVGLLYLAWCYGKLKWKYMVIGAGLLALGVGLFWGRTLDSAPWYLKRADLGRPSAQHRASAWRAGLEIMRDHPLGVGWNNAVSLYDKQYSPPEGGAAAITTNDYMMIGTELGIPALLCFVAYVALCYRKSPRPLIRPLDTFSPIGGEGRDEGEALRAACLSGALVFVVAFWFDGGLFKLPTAAMFWVLLELGSAGRKTDNGVQRTE